ncbi:C4b-binding protein alpha chain-like isoform X6 [Varanus komodoensis]|uniref:C4b-binding protein alpha chain-like isoform X6 n=1 Tax=Varanus komodoensis TaxID=61221 RepID=UPI001CF798F0|nr:C4b-binding protein alpha chain-like isoform X6 [Varanus komodoensis]
MLGFPLSALNSRLFVLLSVLSEIHGDCGAPPTLKNAVPLDKDYKDSYLPGHSVTYTCLSGFYNIQGKLDVITCLRDSQWSPLEDFCERKSCGHPGKPENGEAVILTDFLYLAKVHFTCEDGYRLMGYPSIQCALNETEVEWQPKPPKCQQITCSPPPNISHSSHDGESIRIFAYNSTVTYKCDHGFSLMGDASIRCATEDKISGVWEGSKPECKGLLKKDRNSSGLLYLGLLIGISALLIMAVLCVVAVAILQVGKGSYTFKQETPRCAFLCNMRSRNKKQHT